MDNLFFRMRNDFDRMIQANIPDRIMIAVSFPTTGTDRTLFTVTAPKPAVCCTQRTQE